MGGYPEEGDRAGYDPRSVHVPQTATEAAYAAENKLSPRKESEVENLLGNLEKELEVLHMSASGFINNVSEVLSPERDEDKSVADEPSPSSPLGRRIFQATYRVRAVREKLNDANDRVRV